MPVVDPLEGIDLSAPVRAQRQPLAQGGIVDPLEGIDLSAAPNRPPMPAAPVQAGQPQPEMTVGEVARDVAKSAGSGALKGVAIAAGAPSDIWQAIDKGWQWAATTAGEKLGLLSPEKAAKLRQPLPGEEYKYGSEGIHKAITSVSGDYKPQTTAGEYTRTAAEFVPSTLMLGGENLWANALKYGVIPGVASEAAGQATKGTAAEPWARGGAALAAGGITALTSRPNNAGKIVQEAVAGSTDDQLAAAQRLMDDARRMGSPLTLPEAVQQVTNSGTKLADVQRVVEGSQKGGQITRQFYADRAAGNDAMVRGTLDGIAPPNQAPSEIAPRVSSAARAELDNVRQGINAQAEPFYAASRAVEIEPQAFQAIADNPAFQQGLKAVRNDPILGASIKDLPDNAVGVVDAVKKHLDDMAQSATQAGERFRAGEIGKGREAMLSAADAAAPDYAAARSIGAQGRQQILAPLERSPTGELAHAGHGMHSGDPLSEQIKVLFSPNPRANSERQIAEAVGAVAKTDAAAARDLVRQHLEQVFNETSQRLVSGENQWGGAKYAAVVAGNPQQAKNLEAALRALPEGEAAYSGFRRVLDVLEAQGRRQPIGSQTEFNRLMTEALQQGGAGNAPAVVGSPAKWGNLLADFYARFRYGQNTEVLAKLFTSPDAVSEMRKLAKLPANSPQAQALVGNIIVQTMAGAREGGAVPSVMLPPGQP